MQAIKKRQRVQPQSIIRTRQQRKLDAEELNVSMAMNDDIPNPAPLPLGKPWIESPPVPYASAFGVRSVSGQIHFAYPFHQLKDYLSPFDFNYLT